MQGDELEFAGSEYPTVGIEIEFQLLDSDTLDLVDGILPLLQSFSEEPRIKPEFTQCTVEINSSVCTTIDQLRSDVTNLVSELKRHCERLNLALCGAGTHPFSLHPAAITPLPHYVEIEQRMVYLSHTLKTYALHVHVGMPSGDAAVGVMSLLKPFLPILLALSASSPFWQGQDTGFASFRQRILAAMRDYGLPPSFASWREFARCFDNLRAAGAAHVVRDIHWDIRPNPRFGTLEVRVMDVQPTLRETFMLAALVQTLQVYLLRCWQREIPAQPTILQQWWAQKENCFRASHHGVEAQIIVDETGHVRPIKALARELLAGLAETAEELGTKHWLDQLETWLDTAQSYLRQRAVFTETKSLREVAARLVAELDEELLIS
ncbi:carboxylate-amine ligase [Methylocaldum szegediense]|uniref:Putative glutamate--cysteine ligase 2 n=1 Tax=Methylocaldum szegediense TaxID=73780 RepID=A0ABM9HXX6_9GAMM|nr:YbdK family carboxylate-amine ligase [Methylocaldum szegediense]CAI8760102.1 putative glutamate--cysteine ligase 2 [Methylocaldum szegediense]